MSALSKKTRVTLLILAGALLLTVLGGFAVLYTVKSLSYDRAMNQYLPPYGEKTTVYLAENQAFTEAYGEVSLRVDSYSYGYLDPSRYTRLSLVPELPATAEDFAAELSYLTVSIRFSGTHAVNVRFEKTPEGGLELTGWENADE